jgi:cell division septal protein FtsQ
MRESDTEQDTIVRPTMQGESRSRRQAAEKSQNRADQIRARHNTRQQPTTRPIVSQSSTRSTTQKPRAARYVVPTRPVVIRGTVSPLPVQKPITNKARKQYKIALSTPGAEVRLPSISLGRPGWRTLSGFVVVCMLAAIYALYNLPQFQFGPAKVTGAKRVTSADISAVLKTDGMPAVEAKPQELAAALQAAFPEFSMVSVTIGIPASLNVTVVERQPVLFWDQGQTTLWVDRNGFAFPIRGVAGIKLVDVQAEGNPPTLATVSSPATGSTSLPSLSQIPTAAAQQTTNLGRPFLTPGLVAAILELGAQAPEGTPVIFNPKYGLGWKDPEGWQVYFGSSLTDLDTKLAEYKAIVQQLNQQGIKPVMISVEFPHAPFYRLEK